MDYPALAINLASKAFMYITYIYIWRFTGAVHFYKKSLELLLHDRLVPELLLFDRQTYTDFNRAYDNGRQRLPMVT